MSVSQIRDNHHLRRRLVLGSRRGGTAPGEARFPRLLHSCRNRWRLAQAGKRGALKLSGTGVVEGTIWLKNANASARCCQGSQNPTVRIVVGEQLQSLTLESTHPIRHEMNGVDAPWGPS